MYHNFSDEIIRQIEVREPYFALTNLRLEKDIIHAYLPQEQPMENEVGVIAAAEAGRHLAILGSCVLAHANPLKEKHFYIAHKARLKSLSRRDLLSSPLRAEAQLLDFNKRKGKASTRLYSHHDPLVELEVEYHVIKEKVFQKLYQDKAIDTTGGFDNPYLKRVEFNNLTFEDQSLRADLGQLAAESCLGHFDDIPCLPVAVMMHALSRSAGLLLSQLCQKETLYRVLDATIQADNFAFVGDLVQIEARLLDQDKDIYSFHCLAQNESGKCYGDMELTLELIK